MKKIVLIAIAIIASLTAGAQFHVGGAFGYGRDMNENKTTFKIMPEVGYSFNSQWGIGSTLGYEYTYKSGLKTNVVELKPYARWTFYRTPNEMVSLFVDGGVGVGLGSSKEKDYKSDTVCIWNIGLKPGVAFHPTSHFTILAHIGFFGYEGANDAGMRAGYTKKIGCNWSSLDLNLGLYYSF